VEDKTVWSLWHVPFLSTLEVVYDNALYNSTFTLHYLLLCQVNNLMVVGIDTYHDTLRRGRSVAGFVASLNNTCTRYYTCARFQQPGEELHNCLQTFMTSNVDSLLLLLLRWPSIPDCPGQSRFLTTCPRKKITVLPGWDAHLSHFWLDVSDLSRSAHLCSCMLTHWWLKISSDYIRWWLGQG